nr:hypothetical protein [Dietzia sp. DQ11-71]
MQFRLSSLLFTWEHWLMGAAARRYGISDDDWERQIEVAIRYLKRVAGLRRVTSYTELNREISEKTGLARFDFTHPEGRNAMSELLGEVVERTVDELGAMLSAVVLYIDENDAGPGFYSLAVDLGRLPADATSDQRIRQWSEEVAAAQDACKTGRRGRAVELTSVHANRPFVSAGIEDETGQRDNPIS